MKGPFDKRKLRAEEKARKGEEKQQQRIERLNQLEAMIAAQQEKKGLHLPHPLKKRKAQKEINSLQKEIASYNQKQARRKKNKKTTFVLLAALLVLFAVIGILASNENRGGHTPASGTSSLRADQATVPTSPVPETTSLSLEPQPNTMVSTELPETIAPSTEEIIETEAPTNPPVITEDSTFEIFYLDVGQGDAACVLCDGHAMMIDGGNNSESSLIYSFLRSHEITYLDYIVASHPDADHIGGLSGALNYADVGTAYCTVTEHDTETFKDFTKYLGKRGRTITVPEQGETFYLGCAKVVIMYPEPGVAKSDNTSIALRIEYGDTSFFFTGDCENEDEPAITSSGFELKSDVLKVAHHGSKYATGAALLDAVKPSYAVISVGGDNTYGHPTEDVLTRLHSDSVTLYRTDIQGDVHCVSDGTTITFDVERNADFDTYLAAGGYKNYLKELEARETQPPTTEQLPDRTTPGNEDPIETEARVTYIVNINRNSQKFHYPDCPSVGQMKEENKWYFTGTREELIEMGYSPCGRCHP